MLGISAIAGGGEGYYLDAVAKGVDEYYRGVGEAPGWWAGHATETGLEVSGEVASDDLRDVWSGKDPHSGEPLGRFTNRTVGGFDLCWRAPKSVSLLFAFGDPHVSIAVREAHDAAVAAAVGYVEANAAGTRRGRGGAQMEPVDGLVAAMFRHRTSRSGDPHLHTHVLVANLAQASDGQWRTLDGRLLFRHAKTAGYLYQAHLRHELTVRLGVEWQPVERGTADVAGIDRPVIWAFSERRRQIVEHLDKVGFRTARAAQVATLDTRPDKPTADIGTIRHLWDAKAVSIGFDPGTLALAVGTRDPRVTIDRHVQVLLDHLAGPEGVTRQASTFDRLDALRALAAGLPDGAPVDTIEALTDAFLARPDVVPLGTDTDVTRSMRYSTAELLALEERLVTGALGRQGERADVVPRQLIDAAVAGRPTIADEQIEMVDRLCGDGAGVSVVAAAAGTGKTFALAAAHDAWTSSGYEVVGAAVAAKAARQLEASAGIPSHTLATLTAQLEQGRLQLTRRSVLVIDEAGMAGTRQLAPVLDAATAAGAKVVLVGDHRQLPEIDAGGMLGSLTHLLNSVTLDQNRRQLEPWERDALGELRAGDVDRALDAFDAHGRLIRCSGAATVRQAMADDWWTARQGGEDVTMVAIRRSDVDDLNGRARRHLVDTGALRGPTLEIDNRPYQAGDEILCLRNDYRLGVRNGDRATIDAVDIGTRTMRIRGVEGVRTLPTDYLDAGHVTHAYATTIHKAQGATVDRCLVLGTDDLYREAGYVALSRGRTANVLYAVTMSGVDDALDQGLARTGRHGDDLLRDAFHRRAAKQLATAEHVAPPAADSGRQRRSALLDQLERSRPQAPSIDDTLGL